MGSIIRPCKNFVDSLVQKEETHKYALLLSSYGRLLFWPER